MSISPPFSSLTPNPWEVVIPTAAPPSSPPPADPLLQPNSDQPGTDLGKRTASAAGLAGLGLSPSKKARIEEDGTLPDSNDFSFTAQLLVSPTSLLPSRSPLLNPYGCENPYTQLSPPGFDPNSSSSTFAPLDNNFPPTHSGSSSSSSSSASLYAQLPPPGFDPSSSSSTFAPLNGNGAPSALISNATRTDPTMLDPQHKDAVTKLFDQTAPNYKIFIENLQNACKQPNISSSWNKLAAPLQASIMRFLSKLSMEILISENATVASAAQNVDLLKNLVAKAADRSSSSVGKSAEDAFFIHLGIPRPRTSISHLSAGNRAYAECIANTLIIVYADTKFLDFHIALRTSFTDHVEQQLAKHKISSDSLKDNLNTINKQLETIVL